MSILILILVLSLAVNGFFAVKLLKNKDIPSHHTKDARALLHDLTVNAALVEIRRIDPESVFLRSPR